MKYVNNANVTEQQNNENTISTTVWKVFSFVDNDFEVSLNYLFT